MLGTGLQIAYLLVNAFTLALYGADKYRAIRGYRRVRERVLLAAALPGAPGALAGMLLFRHKTRKIRFVLAVPALCLLHGLAAWLLVRLLQG